MSTERIHTILEREGVLTSDLFCTVHAVRNDRIATVYSSHPVPEPLGSWQPLSVGIVGRAFSEAMKVRVDDVSKEEDYVAVYPRVASELAIPIEYGKGVTGIINFESTQSDFFSDEAAHVPFLAIADEIGEFFSFTSSGAQSNAIVIPESELVTPQLRAKISDFSGPLLAALSRDPKLVYGLTPREFEVLVARLLADKGYDVELTPVQKDGGYDVLARLDTPAGPILTLVECKRWSSENPVSIDVVRNLYGVLATSNATNALIATTSYFTKDARALQSALRYKLSLADFERVSGWLQPYFKPYSV